MPCRFIKEHISKYHEELREIRELKEMRLPAAVVLEASMLEERVKGRIEALERVKKILCGGDGHGLGSLQGVQKENSQTGR